MQPICRSYSSSIAVFSTTICCRNYIQVAINNTICWWYLLNRVKNWPQDCVKFTIFMTVKKETRSRYYSFYNLFWSAAYLQPVCRNFYSHWLHAIKDCRKYSKSAGDKITRSMIVLITIKIFAVCTGQKFCSFSRDLSLTQGLNTANILIVINAIIDRVILSPAILLYFLQSFAACNQWL